MPRDLFGDVTRPSISIGNRKWYTLPVSLLSHSAIVFAVVVIPLLATDVLPEPWEKIEGFVMPIAPPPPAPPPRPRPMDVKPVENMTIPTIAPDGFAPEKPIEAGWEDREPSPNIVDGTVNDGVIVAPPPPPPKKIEQAVPVRAGMGVKTPVKTRDVQPIYPAMAKLAGIQGVVIIEATIGIDGRLVNARVLRSLPLLDQAALDAVRQWEFTPSLLNGVPVPVIMTVTVNFTLTR